MPESKPDRCTDLHLPETVETQNLRVCGIPGESADLRMRGSRTLELRSVAFSTYTSDRSQILHN